MKTKNEEYFREQAKLPAPDGFVCIGEGDCKDHLNNYFHCDNIYRERKDGTFEKAWAGSTNHVKYFTPINKWEEKFGPLNKTNMKKGIYTKKDEYAVKFFKKWSQTVE